MDQRGDGVELAHFRRHRAGVRLTCRECKQHQDFDLEAVIERLKARGIGDEHTGITAVARFTRAPCSRCGGTRFETTPAWPPGRPAT